MRILGRFPLKGEKGQWVLWLRGNEHLGLISAEVRFLSTCWTAYGAGVRGVQG